MAQPRYYTPLSSHGVPPQMHSQSPPRHDSPQRKRPKYTRSKTGCLTCRTKKIKCDEAKPTCSRCAHAQRDCNWPEGVAARKKSSPSYSPDDGRPLTASSSDQFSSASSPPTREHSPQNAHSLHLHMPEVSGRYHHMTPAPVRRSTLPNPLSQPMHPDVMPHVLSTYGQSPVSRNGSHMAYSPVETYPGSILPTLESSFIPPNLRHSPPLIAPAPYDLHHSRYGSHLSHGALATHSPTHGWSPSHATFDVGSSIDPYFRSTRERNLIRHFCENSRSFLMACQPSDASNPLVAVHVPLIVDASSTPSPAVEAHRLALLGLAALHQAYMLQRNAKTIQEAEEVMQEADEARRMAADKLGIACASPRELFSDSALAASLCLTMIDILAGGKDWQETVHLATRLVFSRGGPAAIIAANRPTEAKFGGSIVLSPARLLVEMLAVYEIFGTFTSTRAPRLLHSGDSEWWFAFEDLKCNYHSIAIEEIFGLSRGMIPLIAKVCDFVARATAALYPLSEEPPAGSLTPEMQRFRAAEDIYSELENWDEHHNQEVFVQRVRRGNRVHRNALQIMMLRDVFHVIPLDGRVQHLARSILATCQDCVTRGMAVGLIWPVILAGCQVSAADRTLVLDTFEALRNQYCFQVNAATRLVLEVWNRIDNRLPRANWRAVAMECDLQILVL